MMTMTKKAMKKMEEMRKEFGKNEFCAKNVSPIMITAMFQNGYTEYTRTDGTFKYYKFI